MSKYVKEESKPFCVYLQWKDDPKNQAVQDYFATKKEAEKYAKKIKSDPSYDVWVGVFE